MATEPYWNTLPLADCMAAIIDYRGKTPRKTAVGIPLVTAKVVKNGRIETPTEFIDPTEYENWMRRGLPAPGDVLVTTEAPLGEIAQLDERRVALAQRLICLRGKPGLLDNSFLKFLMQSGFVQEQLRARSTGTTVLGIKQSELRRVLLPVPSLAEQTAIARVLGALDDTIDLNRRMNHTLEAIAQALFRSWFVDFDPVRARAEGRVPWGMDSKTAALFPSELVTSGFGEVPVGWVVRPIGDVVSVVGGSTPSTKERVFWEGGVHAWTTPKDLSALDSHVLLESERHITDLGVAAISSGLLPSGTVLLSSRAPIGYVALTFVPTAVNQGFIAMRCDGALSNQYVLQWTLANVERIKERANGTTFLEVSKSNFRPIPVLVPSAPVLRAFSALVKPLYDQVTANLKEVRTLSTLRDLLLPKLLSGELRVKDAEAAVSAST